MVSFIDSNTLLKYDVSRSKYPLFIASVREIVQQLDHFMSEFSSVFVEYDLGILLKHIKNIEVTFLHGNDDSLLQALINSTNSIRAVINGYIQELGNEYDNIYITIHEYRRYIKVSFAEAEPLNRHDQECETREIVTVTKFPGSRNTFS
jgi:hypothetical protein